MIINAPYILCSILFFAIDMQTTLYQFDEGYCEFWYQIPVSHIFSIEEISSSQDSIVKKYTYKIIIYTNYRDSTTREGIKVGIVKNSQKNYIIDFFSLYLPAGKFPFYFEVISGSEKAVKKGTIEIKPDTFSFYCSDIVLSGKMRRNAEFMRCGLELLPLIKPEYSNRDTLFSYVEIYGFVPDSLFYTIHYQIKNNKSQVVYDSYLNRFKYEDIQFDTLSIYLGFYSSGDYTLFVEITDPALDLSIQNKCSFKVKELLPDIADEPFAWEIKYLVSEKEYKKFLRKEHTQQIEYLKRFWAKRNYDEFDKKLTEADEKFSTSNLRGCDTNQGKFYIQNGPPDEIEYRPMETTGYPAQVWYYESRGLRLLWCDSNGDGDYELVGNLDFEDDWTKDIPIRWTK